MKTITVKIKAPPNGFVRENRIPHKNEECLYFSDDQWHHCLRRATPEEIEWDGGIYAFRKTTVKGKK